MNCAYDSHMHLLPLHHVSLSAYLEYARGNPISEAYAQVSAHDYVVSGILRKQGEVRNLVSVMEHSVSQQLALYEDDLKGLFQTEKAEPFLTQTGLSIHGKEKSLSYDKLVVCPLLMDFSSTAPLSLYYPTPPEHNIEKQAHEILLGINEYYQNRPNGFLRVIPFIGINPLHYTKDYITDFLQKTFLPHGLFSKKPAFAGIKVYPPMGFDPDPQDAAQKASVEALYSFCEEYHIPIVTHCDDQGFRMTAPEESLCFTSPERWEPVLSRHKELFLNFAHFGEQYYHAPRTLFPQKTLPKTWRETILSFMKTYPNVYADLSFDGVRKSAWEQLLLLLQSVPAPDRSLYEKRLLFGTDWPLSLAKIPSAFDYWCSFQESPLSEELTHAMLHENPERFLGNHKRIAL